jgi:nitrite reductase/ring-hydroxylating ferredoxin subunit/uncharacterized membrane protein
VTGIRLALVSAVRGRPDLREIDMRSKVQIKGHPLHPALIAFPIAFLYGGFLFDLGGRIWDASSAWTTGAYLSIAAVASGLIAAIPGLIDYLYIVPPDSSGRTRATYHLVVNVTALAAYAAGWLFRDLRSWEPGLGTLVLEAAGILCVTAGGWLGGTLVYRNQIGVDHRYAGAGKWREQAIDAGPGGDMVVALGDELKVNQMKLLHIGGRRLVLARTETGYVAFDDRCTHRGGSLADGTLACGTVTCPWHGSQFDVQSGMVKAGPTDMAIRTYPVKQVGDEVRLTLSAAA